MIKLVYVMEKITAKLQIKTEVFYEEMGTTCAGYTRTIYLRVKAPPSFFPFFLQFATYSFIYFYLSTRSYILM